MQLNRIVTASSPTSYAEMVAAHKARQGRFKAAAKNVRQTSEIKTVLAVPVPLVDVPPPMWASGLIRFDQHVLAYRAHLEAEAMIGGHRIKRYIRDRAAEFGLAYAAIVGPSRKRNIVAVRHLITWEIKAHLKPEISFPELGRLMGNRDHTTILSSFRKIEAQRAAA